MLSPLFGECEILTTSQVDAQKSLMSSHTFVFMSRCALPIHLFHSIYSCSFVSLFRAKTTAHESHSPKCISSPPLDKVFQDFNVDLYAILLNVTKSGPQRAPSGDRNGLRDGGCALHSQISALDDAIERQLESNQLLEQELAEIKRSQSNLFAGSGGGYFEIVVAQTLASGFC